MKKALLFAAVLALAVPVFAADGAAVYKAKCAMCHGADGAKNTPNLAKLTDKDAAGVIAKGKAPKMPAYDGKLSADEIQAVATYMKSLKK